MTKHRRSGYDTDKMLPYSLRRYCIQSKIYTNGQRTHLILKEFIKENISTSSIKDKGIKIFLCRLLIKTETGKDVTTETLS